MKSISVNPKSLVSVYLVLPIAILMVMADRLILDGHYKAQLPDDPNDFLWFTLIFTLPHILASFFSFFDREYYNEYASRLLRGAQLAAAASILLPLISTSLAFYVFAMLTMIHVFFQQGGVAKSLMRGSNQAHDWWQWLGAGLSGLMYIDIYSEQSLSSNLYHLTIASVFIAFCLAGVIAVKATRTRIGKVYFWSTHMTVVLAVIFMLTGYPILTIALPRIVHDLTAYIYYIAHDQNRFSHKRSNVIYRVFAMVGLPIVITSPMLSVALAAVIQSDDLYGHTLFLVSLIILMHYHTESYIWKSGSLHRRYIKYPN